jgi:Domain of unknown function (DU1801)
MDQAVAAYIEQIPLDRRALFERLHRIVLEQHPDAEVALAYGMPAYRLGTRRLNIGVWAHGVSVYGWRRDNDGGFLERHPELATSKGTIRLSPAEAGAIGDDELRGLLGGALEPEA